MRVSLGAMITASHNTGPVNGIKMVDPKGEMLEAAWECVSTKLANYKDEDIPNQLDQIGEQFNIPEGDSQVVVGRDTRVSSPSLSRACLAGIAAAGVGSLDIGVVTTPQLHYMVVCINTKGGYGLPSLPGYFEKITNAF
jgi:phosphoacetylglucosamine mutase